jgi:hypothetical protein
MHGCLMCVHHLNGLQMFSSMSKSLSLYDFPKRFCTYAKTMSLHSFPLNCSLQQSVGQPVVVLGKQRLYCGQLGSSIGAEGAPLCLLRRDAACQLRLPRPPLLLRSERSGFAAAKRTAVRWKSPADRRMVIRFCVMAVRHAVKGRTVNRGRQKERLE